MARELRERDLQCAIAQAAAVIGDWWSLLVVREVTRGHHRFEDLLAELGISRKVLTERLKHLVDHDVLRRLPYQTGPTRHEYVLTETGWALAPVLISMQDWGDRWLLADGSLTGSAEPGSAEAARVHALLGTEIPAPLLLPASVPAKVPASAPGKVPVSVAGGMSAPGTALPASGGRVVVQADVVGDARATVLFAYPATGLPAPLPPGWGSVPGAAGCTLENRLFRDIAPELAAEGIAIHGVSTQRPDEQAAFAEAEGVTFPLLSDMDLHLAAALRLPTFRAGQSLRLKRLILVADPARVIRHVIFPVLDIPAAIDEARRAATRVARAEP
ncbi:winged helix-turn-helix transcriptional regulator [Sphaerisporangium corydalis]|uniref:Winged helix-turn-helix transcriptional regulator n=1 Tax=Sphaerisporangium corydalis TaxID=1441875 RepID=A0ABV9EKZ2_9ACTN|nr:winged helix-turn-helix transcriptional regulator [Sphaerisporangium corydalis]